MLARVLEPEALDHLAPDDPAAQRSRRDLRRVNAFMGARGILERALMPACLGARARPLRIVELGCGDGLLLLSIAKRRPSWAREVELTLLDRQPIVSAATLAAYAACGWRARSCVADVLDWAAEPAPAAAASAATTSSPAPDADTHYDVAVANLFLHHFEGPALRALLTGCARRADALVACEPRRSRFALAFSHLVFALGANSVTRQDAVLSVRAGFSAGELGAVWPGAAPAWQCAEYDAGLFTHCFRAFRSTGPAHG